MDIAKPSETGVIEQIIFYLEALNMHTISNYYNNFSGDDYYRSLMIGHTICKTPL